MIDLEFRQVSKRYRVRADEPTTGGEGNPYLRKLRRLRHRSEEFWAVRGVSFEVERGEALGIIGHNGAGKSTILKLLASITAPSAGEIKINGRLSALIEVGSGFHPELTGRENVFLSGSILGMRRREIAAKLDSIVEFAGVRQFIDTPVKRYSSGMYVRLGFAIAAHLDPDILLLDEVLAVGDASFQAKCLERIEGLRRAGTTIVFISHDLNAVERLCGRVLLMQHGELVASGSPREVIAEYKQSSAAGDHAGPQGVGAERKWLDLTQAPSDGIVRLRGVRVRTEEGQTATAIDIRRPVGVEMVYDVLEPNHLLVPNYHFYNEDGVQLFAVQEVGPEWRRRPRPVGQYVSTAWLPGNFFSEGTLRIDVAISSHIPVVAVHVFQKGVVSFRILDTLEGESARGDYMGPMPGLIRPLVDWTTHYSADDAFEQRIEVANAV
jgi:lipopolysaccharide transport system ATP-binding protein